MGAAGNVGRKVAEMLLGQEERVRVLEHQRALDDLAKRGAEVVKGDARNVEDLKRLFEAADAALLVLPDVVADPEFAASRSQMSRVIVNLPLIQSQKINGSALKGDLRIPIGRDSGRCPRGCGASGAP